MNGWCTEVQPPSPSSSNIGASTTHRNDHADSSMRPQRGRSPAGPRRAAPGAGVGAGGEEHASPAPAPSPRPGPDRSASERCLATGPGDLAPSSPISDVGQPAGAAGAGPLLPGVELARAAATAPPGITTAPTYGRLEHPEVASRRSSSVRSVELDAEPQVGLVRAVPRHRVGVGHPRQRERAPR